jgi:hypothetical protein
VDEHSDDANHAEPVLDKHGFHSGRDQGRELAMWSRQVKNGPLTYRYESSHVRSVVRRWLLLYWPSRSRTWLYRFPFYFLTFFVIPFLSLAGLGAYLGPDHSLGGVPALLFLVLLAIVVRTSSLRADATLGTSETSQTWHRLSEAWPFPLENPPPRHPVHGYLLSFVGTALISIGFLGVGLAGNGVLWSLLLLSGAVKATLPLSVTIILGILAIVIGVPSSILAFSKGTRLRDRGRRLRARDARTLLQRPGERTVLLLRSFEDEELIDPRPLSFFQQRLEERLSSALKQLGPVITVGRPSGRNQTDDSRHQASVEIASSLRSSQ